MSKINILTLTSLIFIICGFWSIGSILFADDAQNHIAAFLCTAIISVFFALLFHLRAEEEMMMLSKK